MEREQRDPRPPNRRKNGWMESNVFPTTTGPPSIFRPLHRAFSPLPLFLPLSRVISSFTFLVSASSSHPPSRAPLTAFSRFPTLIHLACLSISIRYLFYQFTSGCTRVARPGNSCSVARLTTPRRNFEEEKERERGRGTVFDRFLFLSRFVPSSSSKRTETVGNFQPASSPRRREISSPRRIMHWDRA